MVPSKTSVKATITTGLLCSRSQVTLPMLYALGTGCVPLHIDSFCNFLFDSNIKTCQTAMNMFLFNIFDLKKLVFKKYMILFNQVADYFHVSSFSVIIVTSVFILVWHKLASLKVSKNRNGFLKTSLRPKQQRNYCQDFCPII